MWAPNRPDDPEPGEAAGMAEEPDESRRPDGSVGFDIPLTPMPLDLLLGRIAHEWETRSRILDLPTGRFWRPDDGVDLSFDFMGRRAANPVGPAAGPQTQMAQNIVLAWLGGARVFELKTVQVLDDLDIARPCIDMETIGFNIEWSQELRVAQSIEEYTKASMVIEILRRWEPLRDHLGEDPGPHIFDMSVGYDLAGIRSEKVAGFIETMLDAGSEIERLRPLIPESFGELRDLDFPTRLADTITLSTFHGCPPEEIDSIVRHLVTTHGVDVVVKLNPTLLGFDEVDRLLHDVLGYDDVILDPAAFEADLHFEDGVPLIGGLAGFADTHGHRFGVKLTNTLVVRNNRGRLPGETMYLSGPPLHVIATALLGRLSRALPDVFRLPGHGGSHQVSFSAGVTRANLADTLAMGVGPATICSDLLRPGGYGRLAPMLGALATVVAESGATDLDSWRELRLTEAHRRGLPDTVSDHEQHTVSDEGVGLYDRPGNSKPPRHVDHELEMFGCVACNFCVTVCPNDAFFSVRSLEGMTGRQQYLVLAELCNDCGNCMTFCPEQGDPAQVKPRLYTDLDRFEADGRRGFLVATGLTPEAPLVLAPEERAQERDTVAELLASPAGSPWPVQIRER
ncbi:MAG TPA: 4Fe-4S dicluster domain-containing protein [Acidimicrobiales bacterium]|nr:4Fe-4S dicluster domain-containing protein [Acidimicrobiales bacterium]